MELLKAMALDPEIVIVTGLGFFYIDVNVLEYTDKIKI